MERINLWLICGVKIVVGISPLFFLSCKSQEKIKSTSIDSTIVYHDTIIEIENRIDTFYFPSLIVHDTIIIGKQSSLSIGVKKNQIEFICNEDKLKLKLDSVIQLKAIRIKTIETIFRDECKNQWHIFYKFFFWLVVTIIIIRIVIGRLMV